MATTKLTSSAIRARLERERWHYDSIAPGVALGYRRGPKRNRDGVWSVRFPAPVGSASRYTQSNIGLADDLTASDSVRWLSYREAVERALATARTEAAIDQPLTVGEAVRTYITRRMARGTGRPKDDETAMRKHLGKLVDARVAQLDHATLQTFAHGAPRNVCRSLRAALNATAISVRPSSVTLSALKEHRAQQTRGALQAVMDDKQVAAIEAKARRYDPTFGRFIAVLASTGCRPGQIVRCRVGDLLVAEDALVVPASFKGKNPTKPKASQRLPLDPALVRELSAMVTNRPASAPLFATAAHVRKGRGWQVEGTRAWGKGDWVEAWAAAGLKGRDWRLYDLRHAAVVRMLLAGVPIRLLAAKLDTSTKIIEANYARWIADPNDAFLRKALRVKALSVVG